MRLRQLLAYLQSPTYALAPTNVVPGIVVLGIVAVGTAAIFRLGFWIAAVTLGFFLWTILALRGYRKALHRLPHAAFRTDAAQEWFHQVRAFADDGSLESRADPRMAVEIEGCADAHHRIAVSLSTDGWRKRCKTSEDWRAIALESQMLADDLMADALLVSRPLFRPKGGRHATFEKRCGDPTFGTRELAQLRLIRSKLERLAVELADEPVLLEQAGAYERTLAYLDDLRRAEEEVARLSG